MRRRLIAIAIFALTLSVVMTAQAAPNRSSSNAGDVSIAKRVAFRVTDFPAGWSQVPDGSKDTGCFSGPLKRNSPTAFVRAKRFSSGENGTDAYQTVIVYGSSAGARRALSAVTSPSVFACYKAKLPGVLSTVGLKVESFAGGPLSFDQLGDVVRAFRYKVSVSKSGQKDALFLDYVFVRRGRVLVSSGFTQASSEPDVYTEHATLAKVTARIPRVLRKSA